MNDSKPTLEEEPPKKQPKTMLPQAPVNEWPEAWLMPDGECKDQKALNQCEPNVIVGADELKALGIK